jgi:carbohydrate kinase (thermoresistant glucokinase family)
MIFVIMGVAGSGKTTVGRLLAERLGWPFFEGDDFHPKANVDKMTAGIPLTDEDRAGWLGSIAGQITELDRETRSGVFACSALKDSYRKILANAGRDVRFVYLKGDYDAIKKRLESRKGHFMKPAMLESQFEILEEPKDSLVIEIKRSPEEIMETILKTIQAE